MCEQQIISCIIEIQNMEGRGWHMNSDQDPQNLQRRTYPDQENSQAQPIAVKPSISNERTQLLIAAVLLVIVAVLIIEWQW